MVQSSSTEQHTPTLQVQGQIPTGTTVISMYAPRYCQMDWIKASAKIACGKKTPQAHFTGFQR